MSTNVTAVSDNVFETEVIQSKLPVLVDFWADWCGPCKMIAPILEEIAETFVGRLKVVKFNIDDNGPEPANTPRKYGIRGIPTLLLFKNGQLEATKVGALSKSQLITFIEEIL